MRLRTVPIVLVFSLIQCAVASAVVDVPTTISGAPGSVVALPIRVAEIQDLTLSPPAGVQELGQSSIVSGRSLVTFLIGPNVLAGPHPILVVGTSSDGGRVSHGVTLNVTAVAGVKLAVGHPHVLNAGATTPFTLTITNTGNASDTYMLTAEGSDELTLEYQRIQVAAKSSREVGIKVKPTGFGNRTFIISAVSSREKKISKYLAVSYTVLAFGATSATEPFLQFALPLGASYGTSGFGYSAGLSLSGNLSDFISTSSSFSVMPTTEVASVGFLGSDWGVLYGFDALTGHRLSVTYSGLQVNSALSPKGKLQTGLAYANGPWSVSYSHSWGPHATDTAAGAYTVKIAPGLTSTLALGAQGDVTDQGQYKVSPLGRATLYYAGPAISVEAAGSVQPLSDVPWGVIANVYSRRTKPVRFQGALEAGPGHVDGNVSLQEAPSNALTLAQRASFSSSPKSLGMDFGVLYQPTTSSISLLGLATTTITGAGVTAAGSFAATYTQLPWLASARISVTPGVTVSYGQSYLTSNYSVSGSIAIPLSSNPAPLLGARLAAKISDVEVGLGGSYDFGNSDWSASTSLSVPFTQYISLQGRAGYSSTNGFRWSIGASAVVRTAFAVPKTVSDAFGGRNEGTVAGHVYLVQPDGSKTPAVGITLVASPGDRAAKTDKHGRYQLTSRSGTYTLSFADLPPYVVPPKRQQVIVRLHNTTRKDFSLKVSYFISGQLVASGAGHVAPSNASPSTSGVAGVTVTLLGPNGTHRTTATSQSGNFNFSSIPPGRYLLQTDKRSLPEGYETDASSSASVSVGGDSIPFVLLKVKARPPKVINTLGTTTLPMSVIVRPATIPPGGVVTVSVTAPGANLVEAQLGTSPPVSLKRIAPGKFQGDVLIPEGTPSVVFVKVTGSGGKSHAAMSAMVRVQPGPLATLHLSDVYVPQGQSIKVTVHSLTNTASPLLVINGTEVHLKETAPRTYEASWTADVKPGQVDVRVSIGGKTQITTSIVVTGNP